LKLGKHCCRQTQRMTIARTSYPVDSYNKCGGSVRSFNLSIAFDRRFEDGMQSRYDP
jgi:hypothetical protein